MSSRTRPSDPLDALAYLLKHASAQLTAVTDAALRPLDIDSKDLGVLRVLVGREPTSQQQVGSLLGVDRTTMVALLDTLEGKGIVARRPDPADRRRNVLEVTPAGLAVVDRAEKAYAAAEKAYLAPVGTADATRLRRVLRAIVDR